MKRFRVYYWSEIKDMDMFKDIVKKNKKRLNDYCVVTIYDTYEEMFNNVDIFEGHKIERDYGGRTFTWEIKIRNGLKSWIGKNQAIVSLCNEELTYRVINHEICHIVYGYISKYMKRSLKCDYNKRRKKKQMIYEELMCYMTGSISDQIFSKLV